jgi:hypothetical protein
MRWPIKATMARRCSLVRARASAGPDDEPAVAVDCAAAGEVMQTITDSDRIAAEAAEICPRFRIIA